MPDRPTIGRLLIASEQTFGTSSVLILVLCLVVLRLKILASVGAEPTTFTLSARLFETCRIIVIVIMSEHGKRDLMSYANKPAAVAQLDAPSD